MSKRREPEPAVTVSARFLVVAKVGEATVVANPSLEEAKRASREVRVKGGRPGM